MTTYGFIGAGNMAGAIVDGLIASGHSGDTTVWSAHDSASALAARTGVRLAPSAEELVGTSDVVILAVKPHVIPVVLAPLQEILAVRKPLVVSIAAGLTTTRLESLLPDGTRVVRAMPNMAAAVRESMTALTAGAAASEEDLELTASLMGRVGRTMVLDEKDFSAFTALAGSSPAFIFTFIEALARGGVDAGLPKARAVEIVTQALLGSASMVRREAERRAEDGTGRTLADLLDTACSPGGTTVAGLIAMEGAGFSPAVIEAVRAAIARDRALGV
jgi:pyrroline-5-carboxylate reductase